MSDWKTRAQKVEPTSGWKTRAAAVTEPEPEVPDASSIAPAEFGPEEDPRPRMGGVEALGRSALSGYWKQGSDELAGLITRLRVAPGNGVAWRTPSGGTQPLNTTGDVYRAGRDTVREQLAQAQEQHPYLSFIGNMGGDVMSDLLLREAGVPVASQAYQVAAGALSGLMANTSDLTRPTAEGVADAVDDTALGGAMSLAAPLVGRWVGKHVGGAVTRGAERLDDAWQATGLRDWFTQKARERVLKGSGYIQKDFARGAPQRERLLSGAQELLDEPGLIGPFSSKAGIADRLEPLVDREGRRIGAALDAADSHTPDAMAGSNPGLSLGFDPDAFIADAKAGIEVPYTQNPSLKSEGVGVRRWLKDLGQTADDLQTQGEPFSFRRANKYKSDLQKKVFNPRGDAGANKEAQHELGQLLTRHIDEQAEPLLGPAQLAQFQDARIKFGAFKGAFGKATEGANREVGNNGLGLKDWQAAQTMTQNAKELGGWVGPAIALGSKLVRGRADSFAARTADAIAQPDWLQTLANTQPEVLGKWGQYLGAAAARGPQALSEAHFEAGQSDADYQRRLRDAGKGQ